MSIDGYEPRFDIDLPWGKVGEDFIEALLTQAENDDRLTVEVKRKTYMDDRFYVETHQDPGGRGRFKPSGIQTSTAAYWAFVIMDTGVTIIAPRRAWREAAKAAAGRPQERDGDNPTKGRLISVAELLKHAGEAPFFESKKGPAG